MQRTRRANRAVIKPALIGLILVSLHGCIVTRVIEAESFDSIATERYSNVLPLARKADVLDEDCRWPCYRMGETKIGYFPPRQSENVKAAGPVVPVFPAPGEGKSFADTPFFVGLQLRPGLRSVMILEPEKYLVRLAGNDEPLVPVEVRDCTGGNVDTARVAVFGSARCLLLIYDITRGEVQEFVLVPANVEVDEVLYTFPDIEWTRGTYSWAE